MLLCSCWFLKSFGCPNTDGWYSVAGSETTATLLCGVTNLLLRDRPLLDKLVKAIREKIKTKEELVMENLGDIPYLDACLEEGLRMFPPVPVGLLRIVPDQGSEIDGHFIPAGVSFEPFNCIVA